MARNKDTTVDQSAIVTRVVDFNGVPCYIGQDIDEVISCIEQAGHSVCYLLTNIVTTKNVSGKKETFGSPQLCRYINSPMGNTIVPVEDNTVDGLAETEITISYKLPKIPRVLLDEVDRGFRAVEEVYGTEAIVILTFDMEYLGMENSSDGWGFVVPKQTNTAGACDYEHDSVVEDLPDGYEDHIMIVGSIHSHPKMSAFASHTDDHDQLNFPGIHITYGWQASKGNKTEYHIEFQLDENKIKLSEDEAFEPAPKVNVDTEETKKFLTKVSKASYSSTKVPGSGGMTYPYMGGGYGGMWDDDDDPDGYQGKKAIGTGQATSNDGLVDYGGLKRPLNCPSPLEATLLVQLLTSATKLCPSCNSTLTHQARDSKRCQNPKCMIYLLFPGCSLADLVKERQGKHLETKDLEILEKPNRAVVRWSRTTKPGGDPEDGPFDHDFTVLWDPKETLAKKG